MFSRTTQLTIAACGLALLLGAGCSSAPTNSANTSNAANTTPASSTNSSPAMETKTYSFPGTLPADQIQGKQIRISTTKGDIVFELYPDTAPMAVSNFVYLAGQGFYDGLIFHRVVPDFVIQGGDPLGNGRGGPGYAFNDELNDGRTVYERGMVAMANSGPNTNGSQFFIMLKDYVTTPLDQPGMHKLYTIFGKVVEGMDVVDKIAQGDEMTSVTIESAGTK